MKCIRLSDGPQALNTHRSYSTLSVTPYTGRYMAQLKVLAASVLTMMFYSADVAFTDHTFYTHNADDGSLGLL